MRQEAGKAFFFERKKQKTFVCFERASVKLRDSGTKSFLVLFKKELLASFSDIYR